MAIGLDLSALGQGIQSGYQNAVATKAAKDAAQAKLSNSLALQTAQIAHMKAQDDNTETRNSDTDANNKANAKAKALALLPKIFGYDAAKSYAAENDLPFDGDSVPGPGGTRLNPYFSMTGSAINGAGNVENGATRNNIAGVNGYFKGVAGQPAGAANQIAGLYNGANPNANLPTFNTTPTAPVQPRPLQSLAPRPLAGPQSVGGMPSIAPRDAGLPPVGPLAPSGPVAPNVPFPLGPEAAAKVGHTTAQTNYITGPQTAHEVAGTNAIEAGQHRANDKTIAGELKYLATLPHSTPQEQQTQRSTVQDYNTNHGTDIPLPGERGQGFYGTAAQATRDSSSAETKRHNGVMENKAPQPRPLSVMEQKEIAAGVGPLFPKAGKNGIPVNSISVFGDEANGWGKVYDAAVTARNKANTAVQTWKGAIDSNGKLTHPPGTPVPSDLQGNLDLYNSQIERMNKQPGPYKGAINIQGSPGSAVPGANRANIPGAPPLPAPTHVSELNRDTGLDANGRQASNAPPAPKQFTTSKYGGWDEILSNQLNRTSHDQKDMTMILKAYNQVVNDPQFKSDPAAQQLAHQARTKFIKDPSQGGLTPPAPRQTTRSMAGKPVNLKAESTGSLLRRLAAKYK